MRGCARDEQEMGGWAGDGRRMCKELQGMGLCANSYKRWEEEVKEMGGGCERDGRRMCKELQKMGGN